MFFVFLCAPCVSAVYSHAISIHGTCMQLVILDRDGVINEDSDDYIKSPGEWHPIPGSLAAIARLHRAGWRVVVATMGCSSRRNSDRCNAPWKPCLRENCSRGFSRIAVLNIW